MIGRIVLAGTLIVVAILSVRILTSEVDTAAISGSRGEIRGGERFGVRIGSNRENAIERIRSIGFDTINTPRPEDARCLDLESGEIEDVAFDSSWRNGVVCVASRGGRISAISWNFYPFGNLFP